MRLWKTEKGQLRCQWTEPVQKNDAPQWMQDGSQMPSGHLPPLPDFASHSPFGGSTSWFQLHVGKASEEI